MTKSLSGSVFGITKYANGDMEIIFVDDDEKTSILHYFGDQSKKGQLPKEIAHTMAEAFFSDIEINAEIFFDDNGIATSIKLTADLSED